MIRKALHDKLAYWAQLAANPLSQKRTNEHMRLTKYIIPHLLTLTLKVYDANDYL